MRARVAPALLLATACSHRTATDPVRRATPVPVHVAVTPVVLLSLHTTVDLPGELEPFERVAIYPKESGFLDWIGVDRGSTVKRGQVLARLVAPELADRMAAAEAKESSDQATLERLRTAAATPGVVAPNELDVATQTAAADHSSVAALRALEGYLAVTAPFDGVVTERDAHPGALVGPPGGGQVSPIVWMEDQSHLRLVVPVPERYVGALAVGAVADFTALAWPGARFHGPVARAAHAIDPKTRSMPVEVDVDNSDGRLAPGMYVDVAWPVQRAAPSALVPASALVADTEAQYLNCVRAGKIVPVPVQTGITIQRDGAPWTEVFGALDRTDVVITRGKTSLPAGTAVEADTAPAAAPP